MQTSWALPLEMFASSTGFAPWPVPISSGKPCRLLSVAEPMLTVTAFSPAFPPTAKDIASVPVISAPAINAIATTHGTATRAARCQTVRPYGRSVTAPPPCLIRSPFHTGRVVPYAARPDAPDLPQVLAATFAGAIAIAAVLAVVSIGVLGVQVDGDSMTPTLREGDRLLLAPFSDGEQPQRFGIVALRRRKGQPDPARPIGPARPPVRPRRLSGGVGRLADVRLGTGGAD
jgi:hypothetical protein